MGNDSNAGVHDKISMISDEEQFGKELQRYIKALKQVSFTPNSNRRTFSKKTQMLSCRNGVAEYDPSAEKLSGAFDTDRGRVVFDDARVTDGPGFEDPQSGPIPRRSSPDHVIARDCKVGWPREVDRNYYHEIATLMREDESRARDRLHADLTGAALGASTRRAAVLAAERVQFTSDQDRELAGVLLRAAEEYRDSDLEVDRTVTWSAIRTGASMLAADEVDRLLPFLSPKHAVETMTVALKMLMRFFKAYPGTRLRRHREIHATVLQIARAYTNEWLLEDTSNAAIGQQALLALAAGGSSELREIARGVAGTGVRWFVDQCRLCLGTLADELQVAGPASADSEVVANIRNACDVLEMNQDPGVNQNASISS